MLAYLDFSVSTTGMLTGVKVDYSHKSCTYSKNNNNKQTEMTVISFFFLYMNFFSQKMFNFLLLCLLLDVWPSPSWSSSVYWQQNYDTEIKYFHIYRHGQKYLVVAQIVYLTYFVCFYDIVKDICAVKMTFKLFYWLINQIYAYSQYLQCADILGCWLSVS